MAGPCLRPSQRQPTLCRHETTPLVRLAASNMPEVGRAESSGAGTDHRTWAHRPWRPPAEGTGGATGGRCRCGCRKRCAGCSSGRRGAEVGQEAGGEAWQKGGGGPRRSAASRPHSLGATCLCRPLLLQMPPTWSQTCAWPLDTQKNMLPNTCLNWHCVARGVGGAGCEHDWARGTLRRKLPTGSSLMPGRHTTSCLASTQQQCTTNFVGSSSDFVLRASGITR